MDRGGGYGSRLFPDGEPERFTARHIGIVPAINSSGL